MGIVSPPLPYLELEVDGMNLLEIQRHEKQKKVICMVISFLLIFAVVVSSYIQADAFAPAVVLVPAVVVLAILTAYGISAGTSGDIETLGDLATAMYEEMSGDIKSLIDSKASNAILAAHTFGMVKMALSQGEKEIVDQWFLSEFPVDAGDAQVGDYIPPDFLPYIYTGTMVGLHDQMYSDYLAGAVSDGSGMLIMSGNPEYMTGFKGYSAAEGNVKVRFLSSDTLQVGVTSGHLYFAASNYTPNNQIESFSGTSQSYGYLVSVIGDVTVMNAAWQPIGVISGGVFTPYEKVEEYNPENYPLVPDASGDYTFSVPVGEVADGAIDIPLPESDIEHPISLDDVISAYGSLQAFLDAGYVITLGDGTTISGAQGIRDYTRATDVPTGYVEGSTGVSDIPWIRSLVGSIKGVLEGISSRVGAIAATIAATVSIPFDWTKKVPGGPGFVSGIWGFFAVLLALLIAIMGLIAKVVIFIGQLYTIPASSAMIHPTMIQGIEWARGFDSQTGVNLYSLITGVISIALGIVCFKLLRKIITGIGTASPYREE